MNNALSINVQKTKVVLVGTSKYTIDFKDVSQIENNINELKLKFLDDRILGINSSNLFEFFNKENYLIVSDLKNILQQIDLDCLIFYFSGHGFRTDRSNLYLITTNSKKSNIEVSGLNFQIVKNIIESSRIAKSIIILDCCYSGIATLSDNEPLPNENIKGSYIITSSPHNEASYYAQDSKMTYFTDAFLEVLKKGNSNSNKYISLNNLFDDISNTLKTKNLPAIQKKDRLNIANFNLFYNVCYDKEATEKTIEQNTVRVNFIRVDEFKISMSGYYRNYTDIEIYLDENFCGKLSGFSNMQLDVLPGIKNIKIKCITISPPNRNDTGGGPFVHEALLKNVFFDNNTIISVGYKLHSDNFFERLIGGRYHLYIKINSNRELISEFRAYEP